MNPSRLRLLRGIAVMSMLALFVLLSGTGLAWFALADEGNAQALKALKRIAMNGALLFALFGWIVVKTQLALVAQHEPNRAR